MWLYDNDVNDLTSEELLLSRIIICVKPNKLIYNIFVDNVKLVPISQGKWQNDFPDQNFDWPSIYLSYIHAVMDPKIRCFQFKFLHRIVSTNEYLFKIGFRNSSLCTFCKKEIETLKHLFWDCPFVSDFWFNLSRVLSFHNLIENFDTICFGLTNDRGSIMNFVIFHAKYFIFCCKCNDHLPFTDIFVKRLSYFLKVEKYIYVKNNKLDLFLAKVSFLPYLHSLCT